MLVQNVFPLFVLKRSGHRKDQARRYQHDGCDKEPVLSTGPMIEIGLPAPFIAAIQPKNRV